MIPHSAISTTDWSTIPSPRLARTMAGLLQLEHSQWLTPQALRERQFGQLAQVVRHAIATVPYYRNTLTTAGIDPARNLSASDWARVPLLSRVAIQQAGSRLHSTAIPPGHGDCFEIKTSGSTGEPVCVIKTRLTHYFWRLFTLRDHLWHRRNFGGTLAAIRAFEGHAPAPHGTMAPNWGAAAQGIFNTGRSFQLDIGTDVSVQAHWLAQHDPDYLLTYPSNLLGLISYCEQHGITLPSLKEVRTVGEIVTPSMREACQRVWSAPLVDTYSSQEFGYLALQCPETGNYHVQSENALVEVLDADGNPCAPGMTGRLVITSLNNFAMPLIRYEIGDHAEVGAPCPCGRGLPTLTKILGRSRNMLILPNGEQRWPLVGFYAFRDIAPIQQYQFIQHSVERIEARLVVERPLTATEEAQLISHVQESLGHPFQFEFNYLPAIPRGRNGKYEEFVCAIKPPL